MRLLTFALILSLSQTAWAEGMRYVTKEEVDGQRLEFVDRFLTENVWPHVKTGDGFIWRRENSIGSTDTRAITHYLRALVEIEMEKLRRGK